jgi:hypothetical protein
VTGRKNTPKNDLFLHCRRKMKQLSKKELSNVAPASVKIIKSGAKFEISQRSDHRKKSLFKMYKVRQKLTQFSLETSIAEVKNICLFFSKKKSFRSFQICFYFDIFFSFMSNFGNGFKNLLTGLAFGLLAKLVFQSIDTFKINYFNCNIFVFRAKLIYIRCFFYLIFYCKAF